MRCARSPARWVLRSTDFVDCVARLLACGGLSNACRRPSYLSLLAQRKVTQRNGLSGPPELQALALEGFGTGVVPSVRPGGHAASRPVTGARGRGSLVVALRLDHFPGSQWRCRGPDRHSGAGRNPVATTLIQAIRLLDPGLRRDDEQRHAEQTLRAMPGDRGQALSACLHIDRPDAQRQALYFRIAAKYL
jgi:hypothetical protein